MGDKGGMLCTLRTSAKPAACSGAGWSSPSAALTASDVRTRARARIGTSLDASGRRMGWPRYCSLCRAPNCSACTHQPGFWVMWITCQRREGDVLSLQG